MKGEEGRKEGRKGREMMLKTGKDGKIQSKKEEWGQADDQNMQARCVDLGLQYSSSYQRGQTIRRSSTRLKVESH